jgi:hypothetical protein
MQFGNSERQEERQQFFFEKKNQKTFILRSTPGERCWLARLRGFDPSKCDFRADPHE